jgi:hypothetical protein
VRVDHPGNTFCCGGHVVDGNSTLKRAGGGGQDRSQPMNAVRVRIGT